MDKEITQVLYMSKEDKMAKNNQTPRPWREEDGVIYFSVTPDGTTGEDWIKRLESKGTRLRGCVKRLLRSPGFQPSTVRSPIQIAVFKAMLFEDNDRTMRNIRVEAEKRGYTTPNVELACLIREKFTDKELEAMGLWYIVTMHEPIIDSGGNPILLGADRRSGGHWLYVYHDCPDSRRNRDGGFAFAVSQKGAKG